MNKTAWLALFPAAALGCGFLGNDAPPQAPFTMSAILPTVSFPTGLDCSNGGADPISVAWNVKPMALDNSTVGMTSEFSGQEILANTSGSPTVCYYTPATPPSVAFGTGLRPGRWQLSLTHYVLGYPSPILCTQKLLVGNNAILFAVDRQTPGCQLTQ